MIVPRHILRKWRSRKEYGDVIRIARKSKKSVVTISSAINSGNCSRNVFEAISSYYNSVEKDINSINP